MITIDRLREVLDYNPDTGVFTWKDRADISVQWRGKHVGTRAGTVARNGYREINITGRRYMAHRLVWFYQHGAWPKADIDHINLVRDDNRIENLRQATRAENIRNRGPQKDNALGIKGVSWDKKYQKFTAKITSDGKSYFLGYFADIQPAIEAYQSAAVRLHKEFARV